MVNEKCKINSSEDLAPPKARSLRSRKRKSASEEIPLTDDVQALHQQCAQSPVQECANQQDQGLEQSCATEQEKDAGYDTNVELTEQDVTNPPNNSQLEDFQLLTENDTNKSGANEEETGSDECQRSLHQIRSDQVHVASPIAKEGDQPCAPALNAKENSDVERNQQTAPEEPVNVCTDDILIKEATAGLPAKKKRRMGMCGLTEKERCYFLLTQKHENGQNRKDKVEKHICDNTAEPVAVGNNSAPSPSSPPSIPAGRQNVELSEEALKLQSSHCEGDERAESEAHGAVGPSDGSTAVCDPGCSEGKDCEREGGFVTDSEQAANSDQPEGKGVGENLSSQTLQELKARTNEGTDEIPEKHEEDGSAEAACSSAISFCTSRDEKTDNWDAVEAPILQVKGVSGTRDEKKEEMSANVEGADGADEGASCSHTQPGGLKCGSVELCEAAATPSVSERKDSCDSARPSAAHAERAQTLDTVDSFGSGCLGYLSDSQLNTMVLIEDEMMRKDEGPDSSECHEDATDLICGLIRELASLNRKVMASHRELESLRRSSKTSRSSTR